RVKVRGRRVQRVSPKRALYHTSAHRKRTVSEVQFMHNRGEHKQVQERREWLQMRLRGIHTAGLDELSDLTSEEIQHALNVLEELLNKETV
uniref:Parathyroid hormone n=1 Tax=Amphilophus citrinellus TaxID=61819 RepID=A0A3Q0QSZ6_AMPCI